MCAMIPMFLNLSSVSATAPTDDQTTKRRPRTRAAASLRSARRFLLAAGGLPVRRFCAKEIAGNYDRLGIIGIWAGKSSPFVRRPISREEGRVVARVWEGILFGLGILGLLYICGYAALRASHVIVHERVST